MFKGLKNIGFFAVATGLVASAAMANEKPALRVKQNADKTIEISLTSNELQGDGVWIAWQTKLANLDQWGQTQQAQMERIGVANDGEYKASIGVHAPDVDVRYAVYVWHEDTAEKDWLSGEDWLKSDAPNAKHTFEQPAKLAYRVRLHLRERNGNQWVATTAGVHIYNPEGTEVIRYFDGSGLDWPKMGWFANNEARAFAMDHFGRIWIGLEAGRTGGGGLVCLDVHSEGSSYAKPVIKFFDKAKGLPSHHVSALEIDREGNVIVTTNSGKVIVRLDNLGNVVEVAPLASDNNV